MKITSNHSGYTCRDANQSFVDFIDFLQRFCFFAVYDLLFSDNLSATSHPYYVDQSKYVKTDDFRLTNIGKCNWFRLFNIIPRHFG